MYEKNLKLWLLNLIYCLAILYPNNIAALYPNNTSVGPYLDSSHGNTSYGVMRSSISSIYSKGHCAHCHEQHASIEGIEPIPTGGPDEWLLFSQLYTNQTTSFCLDCHSSTSQQVDMPFQYSYSKKFGGDNTLECPNNIKKAFGFITEDGLPWIDCNSNNGSSHQLTSIRDFLKNKWDKWGSEVNFCSGCHNPHKAQRHSYPVASKGTSPISLPSTHDNDWNVYGAELTERMSKYKSGHSTYQGIYQAPYYCDSNNPKTTYEPVGDSTYDGSNMPDYLTLCIDCHNHNENFRIVSPQKANFTGGSGELINPDWDNSPHGSVNRDNNELKGPYEKSSTKNYILSCTDCHEPHGSPNGMLIRTAINGETGVIFTDWQDPEHWLNICERCHVIDDDHKKTKNCGLCHTHDGMEPI